MDKPITVPDLLAARSAGRIWLPIIGVTAVLCLAAFLSGDWRVRP